MQCISINHKKNSTSIRECFALGIKEQEEFLKLADDSKEIDGAVLLMTCNRCEIYFTGTSNAMTEAEKIFVHVKKCDVEQFRSVSMRYDKKAAIRHLYHVVCGLDSAVLGEVEIIRQVKNAYTFAKERNMTDALLNIIFQGALGIAKETAEKSCMTRLPVSVGTLTTGAALRFCEERKESHILLVGATGDIGSIIMKDMMDACDDVKIVGTSRKHKKDGISFADTDKIRWIHYDSRYEYINWADVIISATNSPHYTFLVKNTKEYIDDSKERLFIDLAIPRDIEEDIDSIPGCVLKNMDYIKSLAKENNDKKISEAKKIEILIQEKVEEIEKVLLFRDFVKNNDEKMEYLNQKDAAWLLYYLREHVDYNSFEQILDLLGEDR